MKSKPNPDLRRWGLFLVLALSVNLSLWFLATTAPGAASRADLTDFGALQWKAA